MDIKMGYSEISKMHKEGNREALMGVLQESSDQNARRMAAEALCAYCDEEVAALFKQVKFNDPDLRIRRIASQGEVRITNSLRARE